MTTKAIYIYGIIPNFYSTEMFKSLENLGVYAITFQNISAIVSDRDSAPLDFSDREALGHLLVHHQKTIEDLVVKGFSKLVPMRLGTILNSKEEVFKILGCGYDLMIEILKKIEHQTEIDLVVTWADFSGLLKEIADLPIILSMKNEILNNINTPSPVDQVKVGMLVQEKLNDKNKQVELRILEALSSFSEDIKLHEAMNDQMVTNTAFLISRNKRQKFEHTIDLLDEEFKGLLNFKLIGPLPCYSFYTIEVKNLDLKQVAQSKKELGLNEETSEVEIKKAYLEKARLFHPDANTDNGNENNFNKVSKAYHTLLEFSMAKKQTLKDEHPTTANYKEVENLILVKIKE